MITQRKSLKNSFETIINHGQIFRKLWTAIETISVERDTQLQGAATSLSKSYQSATMKGYKFTFRTLERVWMSLFYRHI